MTKIFMTFLGGLVFSLLFFLFPLNVSAQSQSFTPTTVNGQNLSVLTQEVTINVLASVACQLTGVNPIEKSQACLGVDPKTNEIGYVQNGGGMIGVMGNLIAATYTPPAHTNQFVAYMSDNFGIVKPAYAQPSNVGHTACAIPGVGFCGLIPLIEIWKAFRDLAFFVFTVVFTLIGLGVMLRVKVDPRTVMTLENQIPKVIIGLVLITFSYAIAAFLIDLMYVAIYVVFSFFAQPQLYGGKPEETKDVIESIAYTQKYYQGANPFGVFDNLFKIRELISSASGGAGDIVGNIFYAQQNDRPWMSITGFFTHFFDFIRDFFGYVFSWIATVAVFIVLAIAVIVALFRVWFALLYAYIYILLDIIIAPLWIMAGIFPGSTYTFDSWLRDLMANLSAFPTVIAMFLMGRIFMYAFLQQAQPLWVAPLIGNPLRNNGDFQPIASLIAIGIVLITPSAVNMMKELFKAPTFKWSATAFQQIGAGAAVPGRVGSGAMNQMFGVHYGGHDGHGGPVAAGGTLGQVMRSLGLAH